MSKIKLVQGDTLPEILVTLYDETESTYGKVTQTPIDLTDTESVLLKFRKRGDAVTTDISGAIQSPRSGGKIKFTFPSLALSGDAGEYEGEVELTQVGGSVFTIYDTLQFKVRKQF